MLEGVDYSHARPGGAAIAKAGRRFAVRYLYPNPDQTGKGLTTGEVTDLHGHGIAIACVYEGAAGDMRKGHAQGVADAKLAQSQLAALHGMDASLPIYFAKDYEGGLGAAEIAYLAGAASVVGAARVGLYGCWQAIDDAMRGKHASWYWQTYAWSGGQVRAGIHLLQYSNGQWGGTVDLVRALRDEYGQHAPAVAAPAPAPVTAPPAAPAPTTSTSTSREDLMAPTYFKSPASPHVFALNPATGTKRYVPGHEAAVLKAAGLWTVHTVDQVDADAIPDA